MKNSRVGYAHEFSNKLNGKSKASIAKKLKSANVQDPMSIVSVLMAFIKNIRYKNIVIWFKANTTYMLIINEKRIELFRDIRYTEVIFEGQRDKEGQIVINEEKTNGEGLSAIKNIIEKIIENPKSESFNSIKNELTESEQKPWDKKLFDELIKKEGNNRQLSAEEKRASNIASIRLLYG